MTIKATIVATKRHERQRRRSRLSSAQRILFPAEEQTEFQPRQNQLIRDNDNFATTMTSPFFHQTMASQPSQEADNYVEGLDGDYHTRLRFWIDKSPGVSTYSVQLSAIFEAGACINTNKLEKEPEKLKEMALKYQTVVKKIGLDGILLPSEVNTMKILKHVTSCEAAALLHISNHVYLMKICACIAISCIFKYFPTNTCRTTCTFTCACPSCTV